MRFFFKPILLTIFSFAFLSCNNTPKERVVSNDSISSMGTSDTLNEMDLTWAKYKFTSDEVEKYPDLIEQSLVDYLAIFPNYSTTDIDASLKRLIEKTENDMLFFDFVKEKISSYLYHPNSPMRNDLYFEQVLRVYQNSNFLSDVDKKRDLLILELVQKNQVGKLATNFSFIDREGKEQRMSNYKAAEKLIVFYDPTCSHCNEVMVEMKGSDILNKEVKAKNLIVLAIDPLGDWEDWKEYNSNIPTDWVNGIDKSQEILKKSKYNILAYPTIYLLDEDNKVILKDVYFSYVEKYLIDM